MSRIADTFARLRAEGRTGLVTYVTAGDPDAARSAVVLQALDRGGADVLEVGVPFSDPLADGPVIQRASERALRQGATLDSTLGLIEGLRASLRAPIVLFTYFNPVFRMGTAAFIDRARAAGVDGVLVLDLPIEESAAWRSALDAGGLDTILLVSPTTSDARLREAGRLGRGFLYGISRLGVTGVRDAVAADAAPLAERMRRLTPLPVALGFGLSRPEHVAAVGRVADAAVVGSAIVAKIAEWADDADLGARIERHVRWLRGVEAA
ncbi:MAG: tryptophan synthase subunit alpha [Vicinamibacteraceae bacterium]|nr:tryptophan synthase subunit alpha [Vicinamibacteraceae bacterium]